MSDHTGPAAVVCASLALLGVSGWRAITYDPRDWPIAVGDASPAPSEAEPDLAAEPPAPPRRERPPPRRARPVAPAPPPPAPEIPVDPPPEGPATEVPRPPQLAAPLRWDHVGPIAPAADARLRVFDPSRWPPYETDGTHAMLPVPADPAVCAVAVEWAQVPGRPVVEVRFRGGAVGRVEHETSIACRSGWLGIAGVSALQEGWVAAGPQAVVALWSSAYKYHPEAEIRRAVDRAAAAGVALAHDDLADRWERIGITAEELEAANAALGHSLRLVVVTAQAWQAMREGGQPVVPLGAPDAPYGYVFDTGRPGQWCVESLWNDRILVGIRARLTGD